MSLEEIRQYIDDIIRLRNTSCLTFLGGEPLLYPQLNDAISYAKQRLLNVGLYSNGLLLDDERLIEFRDLGVSYILIHVTKHQGRGDTEEDAIQIRERFCDMFRRVGGVQLGFSFQFMEEDLPDLHKMVESFTKNADIVKVVGFVPCTNVTPEDEAKPVKERCESQLAMCKAVEDAYRLQWGVYLGTRYDDKLPGKISAISAYYKGKLLGSVDSDVFRNNTARAYKKNGKYPYIEKISSEFSLGNLRLLFFNKSIRSIHLNLLKYIGLKIDWQYITVSFSPLLRKEGLNFCDSCIDSVLYKGKLMPMCALEDVIKLFGP